jgi:hypothetical protein
MMGILKKRHLPMDDHHLGYIKKFLKEHSVTEQIHLGAT